MLSVFRQTLGGYRASLIEVSLGLFGISVLLVYTLDAFGGIEAFGDLLELIPESLRAMLKAQGGFATDSTGYLSTQYRHPFYLIATSGFVIAMASGAVAREVERGTALMLLAAPIARWRYLGAKMAALVTAIVLLLVGAWAGTWVGTLITGMTGDVQMVVLLRALVNLFALALAVGGIAMLLSSVGSDGGHVVSLAAGTAVVMFVVDFLAVIWSPAEPFGVLSVFHYYDPLGVSQADALPWRDLAVLFGVAFAGSGAALVAFQRRDIAP